MKFTIHFFIIENNLLYFEYLKLIVFLNLYLKKN